MFNHAAQRVLGRDKELFFVASKFLDDFCFIGFRYGFFDRTNFIFKLFWVRHFEQLLRGSEDRVRTSMSCLDPI